MVGFLHTANPDNYAWIYLNLLKKCHIFLQFFSQWEIHYDWGIDLGHLDRGFAEDDL
jgi:hypothetical protein